MKTHSYFLILIGIIFWTSCTGPALDISSPDGKVKVQVLIDKQNNSQLAYQVVFDTDTVLAASPLHIELSDTLTLTQNVVVQATSVSSVDETWMKVWGKKAEAINRYKQLAMQLKAGNITYNLYFRVFNDGVAYSYEIPEQEGLQELVLTDESSSFVFAADNEVWAANYEGYTSHQESEFEHLTISTLDTNAFIGLPVLIKTPANTFVAITEAKLVDWAGMYLRPSAIDDALDISLSPRVDDPAVLVMNSSVRQSPWRVIMLGNTPGALIESDIVANLNDPNQIQDVTWIKPGKSAWDWWWPNKYSPEVDFKMGPNTATMKHFIDLAAENGWEYQLVDWQWYGKPFDKQRNGNLEVDITKSIPEIDIPELVAYGAERNVKILLWLHWEIAQKQMEEAFPLYEKWGVAGVKVDFMARDDQQMVQFYHKLVKLAAQHHLMVDFHGAYKPTGFSRTYPNLVTREGVMGNEYNKWSHRITPTHTVTLPYTRGLVGEMDFTPGGFVNVMPDDHKTEKETDAPQVMGTRCHQIAMMVVYESVLQVMCDAPYNYRTYPDGMEFVNAVPTSWDETRFIDGYPGEFIVMARRKGDTWYLGGMTNETARDVTVSFEMLGDGEYKGILFTDPANVLEDLKKADKKDITLRKDSSLTVHMASGGGFALQLMK